MAALRNAELLSAYYVLMTSAAPALNELPYLITITGCRKILEDLCEYSLPINT